MNTIRVHLLPRVLYCCIASVMPSHILQGQEEAFPVRSSKGTDLAATMGFCMLKSIAIERIKRFCPTYALDVQQAEALWNERFGSAQSNIEAELPRCVESATPDRIVNTLKEGVLARVPPCPAHIDSQMALATIADIRSCAEGKIASPFLEVLLAYQYIDEPVQEMLSGYSRVYETGGHKKAKGINIRFRYPASWRPGEGERPNIVQLFTSEYGHGLEVCSVLIKDAENPAITQDMLQSNRSVGNIFPEEATELLRAPATIDGQKGLVVVWELSAERAGRTSFIRSHCFVTIVAGKEVIFGCSVRQTGDRTEEAKARYVKFEPLFKEILRSVVFTDEYQ